MLKKTIIFIVTVCCLAYCANALKIYHVGNSFTLQQEQRWVIQELAKSVGHEHSYDMSCICGAPIGWIWQHPPADAWEGSDFRKALPNKKYDALILQHYDWSVADDIKYGSKFYELALKGNPQCRLYIFNIWPNINQWENPPSIRTINHTEAVAEGITKLFPNSKKVLVIPAGSIIVKLGNMADKGLIPGVKSKKDLFVDNGHLSEIGSYVVACAHYAVLYRDSPEKVTRNPKGRYGGFIYKKLPDSSIPKATADKIKEVVWNEVKNYPLAGIDKTNPEINTLSLSAAPLGSKYHQELVAEGGDSKYNWKIVKGTLPAGLTLKAKSGVISGTPKKEETAKFAVKALDSQGLTSEAKDFSIRTFMPSAPKLAMEKLPQIAYVGHEYKGIIPVKGGYGKLKWTTKKLPHWLNLNTQQRVLSGTPDKAGKFELLVSVTDEKGRSDSKKTEIKISSAPSGSLGFKYYEIKPHSSNKIPDVKDLMPFHVGNCHNFSLSTLKTRNDWFYVCFSGKISIKKEGEYIFTLASDDGSKLFIDGKVVVDNDGRHAREEKSGKIYLKTGFHTIKVKYLEASGDEVLEVYWQSPGMQNKEKIPKEILFNK